jgi:hypothetical protein
VFWQRWVTAQPDDVAAVEEALLRQGEQWRSLLTGEIQADDLLDLDDYRQAFWDYARQLIVIYRKSPWLSGIVLALLAGTGVGIWAIITYAPTGAAVIAGVIAAAAGALGITWKTVAVTVGKAAALLERPLLDDGLREAVKVAAFIPPVDMTYDQIKQLRKEVRKEERTEVGRQPRLAIEAPTGA